VRDAALPWEGRRTTVSIPWILIVVLVLCTAGCTAEPPTADQKNVPEVGAEVRALHVPLDEYKLSRLDLQTIEYAEDLLTRDCMRDLGMDWKMLSPPSNQDPDPLNRRRYGLIEPEIATRFGYHLPPLPPELVARESVWAQRDRLPPAERRAAYGDDGKGGCRAEARDHLREGIQDLNQSRLHDFSAEAFKASREDPEVVKVFGKWSACMKAEGFRYSDPFEPFGDTAWAKSRRPSAQEIVVAEADVRCKQVTDLVSVWSGAEERIQLVAIRSHHEDFEDFMRAKNAELDAARRALKEFG
jgi:hypothetical protein